MLGPRTLTLRHLKAVPFLMEDIMAEEPNAADSIEDASVSVIAQYVKDLSFENPNAPRSLQLLAQTQPAINVNVNVGARKISDDSYEVDLKVEVTAKQNEDTAFVVDLLYSGLFGLRNFPEDQLEPFLVVSAPSLLFPFARRVIADATRDGGFPPLMLEPMDFGGLYLQQKAQQQSMLQQDAAGNA
jgi:preprotein translocase subunit SecB